MLFRFEYVTDPGVDLRGFFADDITLTADGATVFVDGAEAGTADWELDGFKASTGTEAGDYDNYYIAVNRTYGSFDRWLRTGPYNFGFPDTKPNWVEKFSYQPGVLITYFDTSQSDNNTSEHPGEGLALQIDAHPQPIIGPDGDPWRGRIQLYDATFGKRVAETFTLHSQDTGKPGVIAGLPAADVVRRHEAVVVRVATEHGRQGAQRRCAPQRARRAELQRRGAAHPDHSCLT